MSALVLDRFSRLTHPDPALYCQFPAEVGAPAITTPYPVGRSGSMTPRVINVSTVVPAMEGVSSDIGSRIARDAIGEGGFASPFDHAMTTRLGLSTRQYGLKKGLNMTVLRRANSIG